MTTVGSLCSGYGGLDLGLELAIGPVRHAWHVEYDKHPSAILAHRFPGVPNYGDVKTTDWASLEPVDWLTAGYPCQPFSIAGSKRGADDERHLWPAIADAIGALRPSGVLLENVAHHVALGLDAVLWDLAALGYDATWGVVRASDAGAPHSRERVFIVASDAQGHRRHEGRPQPARVVGRPDAAEPRGETPSDTDRSGLEGGEPAAGSDLPAWGLYEPAVRRWERLLGRPAPAPTEPRGRGGAHRLSPRFSEWVMGLPAGWVTDVPGLNANQQLAALGNGVVPQQAALAVQLLTATSEAVAA